LFFRFLILFSCTDSSLNVKIITPRCYKRELNELIAELLCDWERSPNAPSMPLILQGWVVRHTFPARSFSISCIDLQVRKKRPVSHSDE
jgi:hypothetical protein